MLMAINNEEIDNVTLKQASHFFKHDYHDRGMIKWQGYYLSDHTEHVNKIAHEVKHANQARPQTRNGSRINCQNFI